MCPISFRFTYSLSVCLLVRHSIYFFIHFEFFFTIVLDDSSMETLLLICSILHCPSLFIFFGWQVFFTNSSTVMGWYGMIESIADDRNTLMYSPLVQLKKTESHYFIIHQRTYHVVTPTNIEKSRCYIVCSSLYHCERTVVFTVC